MKLATRLSVTSPAVGYRGSLATNSGPAYTSARTTWYFATAGAGGNNGLTPAAPKQATAAAIGAALAAGTSCLIKGGDTVAGPITGASGSSGNPLFLGAYGTGHAIITGTYVNATTVTKAIDMTGCSWMIVRDIDWQADSKQGSLTGGVWLISAAAGSTSTDNSFANLTIQNAAVGAESAGSNPNTSTNARWTFTNCSFLNMGGTEAYMYGTAHIFLRCIFRDWQTRGTDWASDMHGIYSRADTLTVSDCEFSSPNSTNRTSAGVGQAVSPRGFNNVIERSDFYDIPDIAIGHFPDRAAHGRSVVRYCTFWRQIHNVVLYNDDGGATDNGENWVIHNNTISGSTTTAAPWYFNVTTGYVTVKNNVAVGAWGAMTNAPHASVLTAPSGNNKVYTTVAAAGLPAVPATGRWIPTPLAGSPLIDIGDTSIDATSPALSVTSYRGAAPDANSYEA